MIGLEDYFARGWAPPDRRPIWEWAADHVILPESYAIHGRFDVFKSRYLLKVFELLQDDAVRQVNILKAVQSAGTLAADIWLQWLFANSPGPAMWTFQTDPDAAKHWRTRIEPTFRDGPSRALYEQCEKLNDLFHFPHMDLYLQGANLSSLQSKSIKWEVNDEVWIWKAGMLAEAKARTEAFKHVCKILNISQAGEEDSEWDQEWHAGKRWNWGSRCKDSRCGYLHPLEFFSRRLDDPKQYAGVVYERKRRADGSRDSDLARASARYVCPRCGYEHEDNAATWQHFNRAGEYLCEDPGKGDRNQSVRWTALVGGDYGGLAEEYCKALDARDAGAIEPLKKFRQKKDVTPWVEFLGEATVEVTTGEYLRGDAWDEEEIRFLTGDYQEGSGSEGEHYWWVVRAWSKRGSRLIDHGRAWTDGELRADQLRLKVRDVCTVVDCGDRLKYIAGVCAKYGWQMLAGDDKDVFPHPRKDLAPLYLPYSQPTAVDPRKGEAGQGQRYVRRYYWSNPSVKDMVARHKMGKALPWELPSDLGEDYKDQINSEKRKAFVDKQTGRRKWRWVQFKKGNHLWDCECMQMTCALMHKIVNFDNVEELEAAAAARKAEAERAAKEAESAVKPAAKPRRRPAPYEEADQLNLVFENL